MDDAATDPILVVSARWQTRALLAAKLRERAERDIVSVADVNAALGLIKLASVDPIAMVMDAGRRVRPEDVERLLEAKREVPLILVASRLRREAFDALRERCAAYLLRPVHIGRIVEAIVEVLESVGCQ